MRLDETYNRIARELLVEEMLNHRKTDGTTDHEARARAVAERIAHDHPQFDDYQRSECPVKVLVERSKSLESTARGIATARGNGASGISDEERSRDMRLFVYVEKAGYVHMSEATVGEVKLEIDRRREHMEAERKGIEQLEWSVEIAGKLGAKDTDRMGDYVDFG